MYITLYMYNSITLYDYGFHVYLTSAKWCEVRVDQTISNHLLRSLDWTTLPAENLPRGAQQLPTMKARVDATLPRATRSTLDSVGPHSEARSILEIPVTTQLLRWNEIHLISIQQVSDESHHAPIKKNVRESLNIFKHLISKHHQMSSHQIWHDRCGPVLMLTKHPQMAPMCLNIQMWLNKPRWSEIFGWLGWLGCASHMLCDYCSNHGHQFWSILDIATLHQVSK